MPFKTGIGAISTCFFVNKVVYECSMQYLKPLLSSTSYEAINSLSRAFALRVMPQVPRFQQAAYRLASPLGPCCRPRYTGDDNNNNTSSGVIHLQLTSALCAQSVNHAMTTGHPTSNIYPEYCNELSPTIGRWCPLRAVDVHALQSVGMYNNGRS